MLRLVIRCYKNHLSLMNICLFIVDFTTTNDNFNIFIFLQIESNCFKIQCNSFFMKNNPKDWSLNVKENPIWLVKHHFIEASETKNQYLYYIIISDHLNT